ncbi:actin [Diplonema papillatum]|nr:actin [Diplonema papillatum]
MPDWDEKDAVVLDNGSGMMKAGFAGQETPKAVFPAVIGTKRGEDKVVGEEAASKIGYRLSYPVEHGIVNDWDGMSMVWKQAYKELETEPEDQAVMITEAPLNPTENRRKMLEIMFDDFGVPAMYIQIQAVLALYASGRNEGVVLDSGDGVTHAVPVYDGRVVRMSVGRSEVAGRDLTEWMQELLNDEQDFRFTKSSHREWAKAIKEKYCYVADDFDDEMKRFEDSPEDFRKEHELPDGTTITLGRSQFCCPEAIFDPGLMGREDPSIQNLLQTAVWKCPVDCRKTLLANIVLSGGTTLFPNTEDRLVKELKQHKGIPAGAKDVIKVVSDSSEEGRTIRKYTVWMGGAVLASLGSFQEQWITKEEYDEQGVNIVDARCDSLSGY